MDCHVVRHLNAHLAFLRSKLFGTKNGLRKDYIQFHIFQTTIVNGHASPQVENSILNNITNGNGNTTHIESLQNLKATEVLINGEGHIVAEVQPLCEDTTPPKPQPSTLETNGKSSDSGIEVSRSRDDEVALETKRYFKTLTQTTQV